MIEQPRFESYSIPARVCLAIAVAGGVVLVAMAIAGVYFIH
ncbi:hypothetical protein [Bradyrhizobium sp. ORS 111]